VVCLVCVPFTSTLSLRELSYIATKRADEMSPPVFILAVFLVGSCLSACPAFAIERTPATRQPLAPRIEAVTFSSQTLGRAKRFCAVLPEGYTKDRGDWPVLVLLHGRGRNERTLIDDTETRSALLAARFVTVLPDGDDGWYINSPARPADRYETYLEEVIRVAQTTYRLSRRREKRAICGWSMGGYGAMRFAQSHPAEFAMVAPIIGLLDFPRRGLPAGQSYNVPTDRFGDDPSVWKQLNPIHHTDKLRQMSILLITARRAFDRTMNQNFRKRLLQQQIHHRWIMLEGGHTFPVVRRAVPLVVEHAERKFCQETDVHR